MSQTVLLTGVTGFIAKRIALDLLNAGHRVRGTLRSPGRATEVRAALRPRLNEPAALDRFETVPLDLTADDGWVAAMDGVDVVMHTASPFPMSAPKSEDDLIRPAVDGTLRALRAARTAGVGRVVLTSSVVAIEATDTDGPHTEEHWSEPDHPRSTPYGRSKTRAERAAWDFVAEHPEVALTAINPALVLGTPLDRHYGTSLRVVERQMGGKDPALPRIGFGIVDVADISAMHLAAMDRPETAGKRYIGCAGTMTMPEIARRLAAAHPERRITTRVAPKWLLRLVALADPAVRGILPSVGHLPRFDNARARTELGIDFVPVETALERAARAIAG